MTHETPTPGWLDRSLRVFSDVRAGEGVTALLLLVNLFLILLAYYVIKVAREPLILVSGGAEMKTYAAAAQAVVLLGFVPGYSWLAGRVDRIRLIFGVTLFFVLCIELFFVGGQLAVPYLGFVFYVWVGIFSVAIISLFWSYANELYTRTEGERLFPLVGVGATVGSVVGSKLAGWLFGSVGLSAYAILQVSAGVLLVNLGLYAVIERRTKAHAGRTAPAADRAGVNGFALVLKSRYLKLIALLLILLNLVNTTGEYILAAVVVQAATEASGASSGEAFQTYVGEFYGDYFFYVSVGTVLLQAFVVSRIVKTAGIFGVLFALPVIAMGAYGLVAFGVGLSALRWAKTAENMTDYSVMNTAKAMLWLPTTPEEKFNAKQAVDTFFVRIGDVLAAISVFVGTGWLHFGVTQFAITNLVLIVIWLGVSWLVYREYRDRARDEPAKMGAEAA